MLATDRHSSLAQLRPETNLNSKSLQGKWKKYKVWLHSPASWVSHSSSRRWRPKKVKMSVYIEPTKATMSNPLPPPPRGGGGWSCRKEGGTTKFSLTILGVYSSYCISGISSYLHTGRKEKKKEKGAWDKNGKVSDLTGFFSGGEKIAWKNAQPVEFSFLACAHVQKNSNLNFVLNTDWIEFLRLFGRSIFHPLSFFSSRWKDSLRAFFTNTQLLNSPHLKNHFNECFSALMREMKQNETKISRKFFSRYIYFCRA